MAKPMKIRASLKGSETQVKVLMAHAMETGLRKSGGKVVPAHFIKEVEATHGGKKVLMAQFGASVSKNPYLSFKFNGGAKGDKVTVSWKDNKGESRTDETVIK